MDGRLIYVADVAPDLPPLSCDSRFVQVRNVGSGLRLAALLTNRYRRAGAVKCLAKLATTRRRYYAVVRGREIVSDGWILIGRCRAYPIPRDACVVGPIYTSPGARGQGLATAALARAARWCLESGMSAVYIDTSMDNITSQRVITASGFRAV